MHKIGFRVQNGQIYGLKKLTKPLERYDCYLCGKICTEFHDKEMTDVVCECKEMDDCTTAELQFFKTKFNKTTIFDFIDALKVDPSLALSFPKLAQFSNSIS